MKKLLMVIVVALMATSALAKGSKVNSTSLEINKNEKTVTLNFSKFDRQVKLFTITNNEGELIFDEKVDKYVSGVKYNLSTLSEGTYTMKVQGDDFIEMHKAVISSEDVTFENVEFYSKPTCKIVDDLLSVQCENSDEESIRVFIYNNDGELIFKYVDQEPGDFHRVFNLGQLSKDDYNVIVSTDHFDLSKMISL